jgi:uncharacterized protein YndB with AHSA1/START domain
MQLFKKQKSFGFERTYASPVEMVWRAWTRPEMLREWWGPEKTTVPECEIDLRVGGRIYVVTEAGEAMGKYQGTRWPMDGTFSLIQEHDRLSYDARSWTEGEEETSSIHHTNDVVLSDIDGTTRLELNVVITQVGPKAKMAAFGMKWGYKQQLDDLETLLSSGTP